MQSASPPASLLGRHRQLSPSASLRVSPICLGAMSLGDAGKAMMGECTKETAFEILDTFAAQGGNFIDTASYYQYGESEMWLGEWLAARKNRDQMVLATKYGGPFMVHKKDLLQTNYGGSGMKSMRLSLEASLRNLQTDYIDVFYLHFWDFTITIPELMHGLNDLVASGKVLYLGISDTPAWLVTKANQYARDHGLRPFVVYQGMWNAGTRDLERDIVPMCLDEGMGICPYNVLAGGRFQTAAAYKEREAKKEGRTLVPVSEHDKKVAAVLEEVAVAKDVALNHVAVAYVLHKTPYVFPIIGGRKVEHMKGNIPALGVSLTQEDIDKIDSAYEFNHGFPHTFLSGSMVARAKSKGTSGPSDVWLTRLLGEFDWVEAPKPITPHKE